MKFWRSHGKAIERERVAREAAFASEKYHAYRRAAEKAARDFERAKTPRGMQSALKRGARAERSMGFWGERARETVHRLAVGDRKKQASETKKRAKRERAISTKRWRYHPRITYTSGRKRHNVKVEVFFSRRDYARMTEAEVLDAFYDLAIGRERKDLIVGAVRYGWPGTRKPGPVRASNSRQALSDLAAPIFDGQLEDIGEEEINEQA